MQFEHPGSERPSRSTSRRSLLLAGAAGLTGAALAACSSEQASEVTTPAGTTFALAAVFPRAEPFLVAGIPQRLPFTIIDAATGPLDRLEPTTFRILAEGREVVAPAEVAPHADGLPRGYLPVMATFPQPGTYTVEATFRGQTLESTVEALPRDRVPGLQVGDALPKAVTPTVTSDDRKVDPRCTNNPECPFHAVSLDQAVPNGRPTVLLVATPAYCQTAICGPVLDLLIELAGTRTDLDVIHAEPWANPKEVDVITSADPAPIIAALGLSYEPVLYVTDAQGNIRTRLDLAMDRAEMAAALA